MKHPATYFVTAGDDLTDRGQQFTGCACQLVHSCRTMIQSVLDSVLDFACRGLRCGGELLHSHFD